MHESLNERLQPTLGAITALKANGLLEELMQDYPALNFDVQKYFIHMPRL